MKEIKIETNFNSKLDQQNFVHISFAPIKPVAESELNEVMILSVKDGSHEPVYCKLVDMGRCQLIDLDSGSTQSSYGLDANDFVDWWVSKYPSAHACTEMAIYVYQKLSVAEVKVEQRELFAA